SVACGTATCSGIMFMGMGAGACCADAATGACGTMQGGACMAKPPVAENCPKIPPIFGMMINSCCKPDNTCGVDGSALGMGCGNYSGLARFGGMAPPETTCDGVPIAPAAGAAGGGAAGMSAAAGSSAAGASAAAGSSAAGAGARAGTGGSATGAAGSSAGAAGARAGTGGSATGAAGARAGAGGR
ncbi:MAG TPA: hypothetical protein VMF89_09255, partial [Polyangiales bacterium]|nr:hypothetical protein [Polyangiales bacterium]